MSAHALQRGKVYRNGSLFGSQWPSGQVWGSGARGAKGEREARDRVHRTYSNGKKRTDKPVEHRSSRSSVILRFLFSLSFSLSVHFPFTILRFYDSFLSFFSRVREQVSFQQSRAIRVTIPLGFRVCPSIRRAHTYIYIYIHSCIFPVSR